MREMKDSGVVWIGEIPADWSVEKLKFIASFCQEKYREDLGALVYVGLENIVSWNGKFVETESEYDRGQSILFSQNDILWGKLRPYLAKVFHCQESGCCSSEFCVIRPQLSIDVRFLWNTLISVGFVSAVDQSTYGTKMPRANTDFIKNMLIPIPPVPEQKNVGAFLDRKCKEIDAVLEETRASIEEYKKLKQAIITQAVTKGVRGDRPMKESGIEWVGRIPADWDVRRIKTLFSLRDERNTLPLAEVNLISLYTDQGVVQHADLEKTTGNKASNADGYKKVYQNDIIVNIILCWMGAIGRSDFNGVTSPAYDVYIPTDEVESRFYHYYFRTTGFSGDCYKRGRGIMAMRWRTYSDQFRDIPVVFPPIGEQQAIVKYLDRMCTQVDALIAKKEKVVSELETYKKSLIYEYVTGKKEV